MTEYIKKDDATIFILDLTNAQSFKLIKDQINFLPISAENFKKYNTILLANRWDDFRIDELDQKEAKKFAKNNGLNYHYLSPNKDIKNYLKEMIISLDRIKFDIVTSDLTRNK